MEIRFCCLNTYSTAREIGTLDLTLSKDGGLTTEKQMRNTSVCG